MHSNSRTASAEPRANLPPRIATSWRPEYA
jgi:hypothetical protein